MSCRQAPIASVRVRPRRARELPRRRVARVPVRPTARPSVFDLRSRCRHGRLTRMNDRPDDVGPAAPAGPGAGAHDGDAGLFGPDSITWRLHAEPLMGVAGLRALLLQALHPVAMAAIEQERTSHDDVWARLSRTAEYVAVTTFGSTTDAMLAASRIRAIHARVHGVLPTGVEYSAEEPQLLAWVHCCLVASFLEVLTRGGLSLTGAEQDAYVAEQMRAAMLVGLEPDEVPHDRAALQDYFRVIKPALECTPPARRAAVEVVAPPMPTRLALTAPARPAWAGIAGLAYAALPPWG